MEFVVNNKVLKEIKIDYQKDDVKDLIIPNGVEELGKGALCYIPLGLESIYIPKSVKEIPTNALFGEVSCFDSLKTIIVEDGNENYKSESGCLIDINANAVILGTEKAVIPSGIEKIGFYAFRQRENLTEITIPATVKEVGPQAFACCHNLKKVTVLGERTNLNNFCFIADVNIEEFNLPKNSDYEFVDGCLVKKSCETLLLVTHQGEIPNNIVKLASLSCVRYFSDLVVPETVVGIEENAVLLLGGGKLKVKKDSKAYDYAIKNNLHYEEI